MSRGPGELRGESWDTLPPIGSHRNVLTHLSAFAQAVRSAKPALPYLGPSPSDGDSRVLQDSVPGSPPLGSLLQCPRMEGIPTFSVLLWHPQWSWWVMVICLGVCSPATHSEFLRIRAKSQVSLYPRAEPIVGTPQMCAEEWIVLAASLDTKQDPIPA